MGARGAVTAPGVGVEEGRRGEERKGQKFSKVSAPYTEYRVSNVSIQPTLGFRI
jgi:hypothetical protein